MAKKVLRAPRVRLASLVHWAPLVNPAPQVPEVLRASTVSLERQVPWALLVYLAYKVSLAMRVHAVCLVLRESLVILVTPITTNLPHINPLLLIMAHLSLTTLSTPCLIPLQADSFPTN